MKWVRVAGGRLFHAVMQRQERHSHHELIAALTGQQASWWLMSGGGNDLPHWLFDKRSQQDLAALIH